MKDTVITDSYIWEWVDGVSLSCLTTGQCWDASHWSRDDWDEFCSDDHDKIAHAEMMNVCKVWGE